MRETDRQTDRQREREKEGNTERRKRGTIIYNSMLYFYLCIKAKLSPKAYPQNGKTTLASSTVGKKNFCGTARFYVVHP
jgi:hypothetical protein